MDALEKAKELVQDGYYKDAAIWATIAQAEQTKRLADAAERQAVAVEKRNELLAEYNSVSIEQHTIYRSEVIDFFNTMFGAEKEVTASE